LRELNPSCRHPNIAPSRRSRHSRNLQCSLTPASALIMHHSQRFNHIILRTTSSHNLRLCQPDSIRFRGTVLIPIPHTLQPQLLLLLRIPRIGRQASNIAFLQPLRMRAHTTNL
jgi:hypothetical protein